LGRRLLLLAWDAADWRALQPLLDQGRLPNLNRLVEQGLSGGLASVQPSVPPVVWTSIATGRTADLHGVLGRFEPDPISGGAREISTASRRGKAVWNILHQQGLRPHVVNWFASHPAEPLRGSCVSNAFFHLGDSYPPGAVHPPELAAALDDLRVEPSDLTAADLRLFVPALETIDQEHDKGLTALAAVLASTITAHAVATWILEHREWDFLAVSYETIGRLARLFPPSSAAAYAEVLPNACQFHDLLLGRLLQLAGPEATVMIVSAGEADQGIFCLAGPGVPRDELVFAAGVLDLVPTILALYGLPKSEEMPGRALAGEAPPPIPSWDALPGDAGLLPEADFPDPWDTAAALDQLAALGYADEPSEENVRRRRRAEWEREINLARVQLAANRPGEAVRILEPLAAEDPSVALVQLWLAQACRRAGDAPRCRAIVDRALAAANPDPAFHVLRANLLLFDRQPAAALDHLRAAAAQPENPGILAAIGRAHLSLQQPEEAEAVFRGALERNPHSAEAWRGLAGALLIRKRHEAAAEAAIESLNYDYNQPAGHLLLGSALSELGELARAARAFEFALRIYPQSALAHDSLAGVLERQGDAARAAEHRRQAEELRRAGHRA
jgi:tetratricopeptide (TPR) repeat protein